jgi:hypothetical protein
MNSRQKYRASHSTPGRSASQKKKGKGFTPIITLRGDEGDPTYRIRNLDRNTLRQKAISIRASTSWIDTFKTPNGGLGVPFFDNLGRYTGHLVYRWSCDPRSLITTAVATVADRLLKYCWRHNKRYVVKRFSKALLGAAAYYVMSKNSHFWDRVLFFCRDLQKRGSLIHRLRLFFSSKWNDNKRFVISQVIFQTNWLLFRVYRPRDKFHFFSERVKRTCWREPTSSPSRVDLTTEVREIAYAISQI